MNDSKKYNYLDWANNRQLQGSTVKLNEDQKDAFSIIKKFLDHPAADTLVLKGYAGTGKTFLMQYLGHWLNKREIPFTLLASTGRAATILRGKTGFTAGTVHGELYRFSRLEGDDDNITYEDPVDKYGQMTLQFGLRMPDQEKRLYIVDESSMLSSEVNDEQSILAFGSGILMTDFFEAVAGNKILFVGDPCQLPPVGQSYSPALDMDWLASQGRIAVSVTLNKIERTDADNDILLLASYVRNLALLAVWPRYAKLPARFMNNVQLYSCSKTLFQAYREKYEQVGAGGALAIARSNKTVMDINRAVRRDMYGQIDLPLQVNDVLLVVQNNYAVPLTNGDFIVVTAIGEQVHHANLSFQSIRLKALSSDIEYEILIALDILYSKENSFTKQQQKHLMIEFSRNMKRKKIKVNSALYKKALMNDPFINSLRAKFGYAVTCHKAQGGEWDHVYLFLDSKMYGMPQPELSRWWYTAITRARQNLYLHDDWWIS